MNRDRVNSLLEEVLSLPGDDYIYFKERLTATEEKLKLLAFRDNGL